MSARKFRSREVNWTSAVPLNQSNVKLKQTKIADWLGSPSSGASKKNLSESDNSTQSRSGLSSSDSLSEEACATITRRSNRLKKTSKTGINGEDGPTAVLQLDGTLRCDESNCNYKTSLKDNLERHKETEHKLKRLQCPNRDKDGTDSHSDDAFTRQTFTYHSNVTFKCKLCSWTTPVRLHLTQHMKQNHGRARLPEHGISRASEFGKTFKCSKCDFSAVKKEEIHSHHCSQVTERNHPCSFPGCGYKSKTASSLREHVKRHDVEAQKEFQCPLCSKGFWTRLLLHNHIPFHTKEKVFSCSLCNFATCYAGNLVAHKRKHAKQSDKATNKQNAHAVSKNEQSIQPSYTDNAISDSSLNGCGNILPNETTESRMEPDGHDKPKIIKERGINPKKILEKKHKCDHCDFTAVYKCKIIRHAVVHRDPDDKIHSCSFTGCDFKTNWEEYLKKHLREKHKSTPDHVCPVEGCDFQAKWKQTLAEHHKKRHERRKRNYQCPLCLKAFYDSRGLKRHINRHTGENKYKCSLCDYVSGESSNFHAHRRKYHSEKECERIKVM